MKKIFFFIILFGLHGYAQKTFEVYNFTGQAVQIGDIITNASGVYPEFHSKPFWGMITVPPSSGSYTLVNYSDPYRFPFHSPTSSPYITTWERLDSPTSSTLMTSNNAWAWGAPQVFDRMLFSIGGVSYTIGTANPFISGPGWIAIYEEYVDINNPDFIIYTIVITP